MDKTASEDPQPEKFSTMKSRSRQGIASAPPKFMDRQQTAGTVISKKPPATAFNTQIRPKSLLPDKYPSLVGAKLVPLDEKTTDASIELKLQEIVLPTYHQKQIRKITYLRSHTDLEDRFHNFECINNSAAGSPVKV